MDKRVILEQVLRQYEVYRDAGMSQWEAIDEIMYEFANKLEKEHNDGRSRKVD